MNTLRTVAHVRHLRRKQTVIKIRTRQNAHRHKTWPNRKMVWAKLATHRQFTTVCRSIFPENTGDTPTFRTTLQIVRTDPGTCQFWHKSLLRSNIEISYFYIEGEITILALFELHNFVLYYQMKFFVHMYI